MKLTIAYLYYDLLNLYGENGNIKILKQQLENQGINVTIKFLSIDDELEFDKYDMVYMGTGTENNQLIALKHLIKYKEDIKNSIENNKIFLITGNSIELFGKHIMKDKKIKCLNIFDFETEHKETKVAAEAFFESKLFNKPFLGFQNQCGTMKNIKYPFFKVIKGFGSDPDNIEGIQYKNFYGTYLFGPILVRNPHFLKYIITLLIKNKNNKFKLKKFDLKFETHAYNNFIKNFYDVISDKK